ncbi:acetylhydrolase [Betaproteobacteria bacterium]|nr:acetylhydrolase [Betaproteobacteria bacterium]
MALTEQARWMLDMVNRVGAPRFHEFSPEQARRSYRKLQLAFGFPPPEVGAEVGTVDTIFIPRPDGSSMEARLYRPVPGAPAGSGAHGALAPFLIFYHGGGWCVGDLDSYDTLCRKFANGSGAVVLAPHYRLAPEHPFPAAPDDALLAVSWARAHGHDFGLDAERIALGGDSAGGALAIVTALALRDGGGTQPRLLVLAYPCTDINDAPYPSRARYDNGYFLDRETLEWFFTHFQGDPADWRASPMCAGRMDGLPPVLLVAAEYDPLVDEGAAFIARVAQAGGQTGRIVVPGMIHGFLSLGKLFPEAGPAVAEITARLGAALGTGR